jgi:hypothetical protein
MDDALDGEMRMSLKWNARFRMIYLLCKFTPRENHQMSNELQSPQK